MEQTTRSEVVDALVRASYVDPATSEKAPVQDVLAAASRQGVTNFELLHGRLWAQAGVDHTDPSDMNTN